MGGIMSSRSNISSMPSSKRHKKVVVIGGGSMGRHTAMELDAIFNVTFIEGRSDLTGTHVPAECVMKRGHIVHACEASFTEFDNTIVADDGGNNVQRLEYDYLVIADNNASKSLPLTNKVLNLRIHTSKQHHWKYNKMLNGLGQKIQKSGHIIIVGGGSLAIHLAGQTATQYPDKKVTLCHSGHSLSLRVSGDTDGQKAARYTSLLQIAAGGDTDHQKHFVKPASKHDEEAPDATDPILQMLKVVGVKVLLGTKVDSERLERSIALTGPLTVHCGNTTVPADLVLFCDEDEAENPPPSSPTTRSSTTHGRASTSKEGVEGGGGSSSPVTSVRHHHHNRDDKRGTHHHSQQQDEKRGSHHHHSHRHHDDSHHHNHHHQQQQQQQHDDDKRDSHHHHHHHQHHHQQQQQQHNHTVSQHRESHSHQHHHHHRHHSYSDPSATPHHEAGRRSSLLNDVGEYRVHHSLQVEGFMNVFAIGALSNLVHHRPDEAALASNSEEDEWQGQVQVVCDNIGTLARGGENAPPLARWHDDDREMRSGAVALVVGGSRGGAGGGAGEGGEKGQKKESGGSQSKYVVSSHQGNQ